MSWSVNYAGKVKDAKKETKKQFKAQAVHYAGTNEGRLIDEARKVVALTLKFNDPKANVQVTASGHAVQKDGVQTGQNFSVSVQLVA